MEERQVKAHNLIWFVAAVSPDRLRDINTGGQPFNRWGWASSGARIGRCLAAGAPEHLDSEIFQRQALHLQGSDCPAGIQARHLRYWHKWHMQTDASITPWTSWGRGRGVLACLLSMPPWWHYNFWWHLDDSQAPSLWARCSTWRLRTSTPPPCLLTAEWQYWQSVLLSFHLTASIPSSLVAYP